MDINGRQIGRGYPPYIVAEISGNHGGDLANAYELIRAAKRAGADAVKFQAYQADTITIDHDGPGFVLDSGPWQGRKLFDLYREAETPFAWFPMLAGHAADIGITWFASVFDCSSVDMLESLGCPAYKIASMEIVDLPLIEYAASKGKPMIISTGMAHRLDIQKAVRAASDDFALLHCVSGYPTPIEQANLAGFVLLNDEWSPVGISDHTQGIEIPIAATALGACMIEKHLKFERIRTADAEFSLTFEELRQMVLAVRRTWAAMQPSTATSEAPSRQLRRSLYAVADIKEGEPFTEQNVRSIRPAHGLPPVEYDKIIGRIARHDIARGTPLSRELIK